MNNINSHKEAEKALKQGKCIRNIRYSENEHLKLINGLLVTEDGITHGTFDDVFWKRQLSLTERWHVVKKENKVFTQPTDITKDKDNGREYASFNYYEGLEEANRRNLKQTSDFGHLDTYNYFIVCCGDVMIRVNPDEYPNIKRRMI